MKALTLAIAAAGALTLAAMATPAQAAFSHGLAAPAVESNKIDARCWHRRHRSSWRCNHYRRHGWHQQRYYYNHGWHRNRHHHHHGWHGHRHNAPSVFRNW